MLLCFKLIAEYYFLIWITEEDEASWGKGAFWMIMQYRSLKLVMFSFLDRCILQHDFMYTLPPLYPSFTMFLWMIYNDAHFSVPKLLYTSHVISLLDTWDLTHWSDDNQVMAGMSSIMIKW